MEVVNGCVDADKKFLNSESSRTVLAHFMSELKCGHLCTHSSTELSTLGVWFGCNSAT